MIELNIKSIFRITSLISLNHHKVFTQISKFNKVNIDNNKKINDTSMSIKTHLFTEISFISSNINSILLHRVNATLIANIEEEIFDISIHKFIFILIIIVKYNSV